MKRLLAAAAVAFVMLAGTAAQAQHKSTSFPTCSEMAADPAKKTVVALSYKG